MISCIEDYYNNVGKKKQLVTVFVLTYNRSFYLEKTLKSLLSQTYDNFYLIILDNLSTDGTQALMNSYDDERVIYLRHSSHPFPNNEFFAFEIYKTKYIVVFHDDDIIHQRYLEYCISEMEKHSEYSAISVNANVIDENDKITGVFNLETGREKDVYTGKEYFIHFIRGGINSKTPSIIYPSVMYRRSFYGDKKYFFNGKIGPAYDQYVWFQTERKGGTIAVYQEKLIDYRIHSSQDSSLSAGYMDLKLFSVLMADQYYANLISQNVKYMGNFIRRAFFNNIRLFRARKIRKKDIITSYGLIDRRYIKTADSKKWLRLFWLLKTVPSLCCGIYGFLKVVIKK